MKNGRMRIGLQKMNKGKLQHIGQCGNQCGCRYVNH